jgi:hypothetical protein
MHGHMNVKYEDLCLQGFEGSSLGECTPPPPILPRATLLELLDPEDEGTITLQNAGKYLKTQRNIAEDFILQQHRCGHLTSCTECPL